ncbi:MAG: toll/interleukin-1 receptor domain-containing protein [Anaerolineae bacterium]|nr:toll/interleukin-1 receptor domain-containing protein [Anaerolineae bacterium]
MSLRPSAFISYSHQDGADFTHRLVFGLSMYMDVFFDIHLQAGDYPKQLFKEIEKRDHFLFVMTPYSIKSKWCRDELEYAEKCGKSITLAMVFDSELVQRHELTERYSYGPFHLDYEAGFRRVTELMLGKATSSWEGFINLEKDEIIEALRQGLVPGIIAKEFVEWLMVEKLWAKLEK